MIHSLQNPDGRIQHYRFGKTLAAALLIASLEACDSGSSVQEAADSAVVQVGAANSAKALITQQESPVEKALLQVLDRQSDEAKRRYAARHPQATLRFFGITPGMTVIEADPGDGWYSKILYPYLGEEGVLVGADYPMQVYELFNYYSEDELAERALWAETWPEMMTSDGGADGARVMAFALGSMPKELEGTADAVLLIRVLHNLADFEEEGAHLSRALEEMYSALKPGGLVGIVQHRAPESHADEWASGANGYLKKSFVINAMQNAGFVFEAESSINKNPQDRPSEEESVWRLPPTLEVPEDGRRAEEYAAIGESDRMTLRFRKPSSD